MQAFTYIILFVSVVFIATLFFYTILKYARERLEKTSDNKYEVYKRFITPEKLFSLRIYSTMISCSLVFSVVIVATTSILISFIASIFVGFISYMLPLLYFKRKLQERNLKFEKSILDLTVGLVNGMKSGQSLPQALEAVNKRMTGPMNEEIMICLREQRLGVDIAESLERLYNRMPSEDLHLLVTAIKLTARSGGSLVDVMEKMIDTIRARSDFQEKLKTMTAQGKFEALAISLSPLLAFVVFYIIDPELMSPMLTTVLGWCAMTAVLILISVGYFCISKIVTIEV